MSRVLVVVDVVMEDVDRVGVVSADQDGCGSADSAQERLKALLDSMQLSVKYSGTRTQIALSRGKRRYRMRCGDVPSTRSWAAGGFRAVRVEEDVSCASGLEPCSVGC